PARPVASLLPEPRAPPQIGGRCLGSGRRRRAPARARARPGPPPRRPWPHACVATSAKEIARRSWSGVLAGRTARQSLRIAGVASALERRLLHVVLGDEGLDGGAH